MTNPITNGWQLIGQRNGKPHYRYTKRDNWYFTESRQEPVRASKPAPANFVEKEAVIPTVISFDTVMTLKAGDLCPKCKGTGIYRWYAPDRRRVRTSTCYWCNDARTGASKPGKGWVDERDLLFILDAAAEGRLSYVASA